MSSCNFILTSVILHMDGKIWLLTRSLQLMSFQAYKLRVTHLYQLKQHSILVSVGQDEHGINPLVSVALLQTRAKHMAVGDFDTLRSKV